MNPLEWLEWIYGKWFVGHPRVGYFVVLAVVSVVGGIVGLLPLWMRAVDRYHEEHGGVLHSAPPPVESQKSVQGVASLPKPPSLFSLFLNDLRPGAGLVWNAFSDFDLPELRGTKVRVFYKVLDDFAANVYFTAFYVPEILVNGKADSGRAVQVITHIANNNEQFVSDIRAQRVADWRSEGDSTTQTSRELVPSRQVYIYYPGALSLQQLATLDQAFKKTSLRLQFRSADYVMAAWQSIRMGDTKAPPEYEVRDGMPVLVGGAALRDLAPPN